MLNHKIIHYFRRILHWRRETITYVDEAHACCFAPRYGDALRDCRGGRKRLLFGCLPSGLGRTCCAVDNQARVRCCRRQRGHVYTLTNAKGAVAKITNYGAIVTELHVPDRNGQAGRRRARLRQRSTTT